VQTYPQMSEDEPGGYCTEVDQCMDQAIALLREYAALLQAQQPITYIIETESAIMTWPITSLDEARTYCDEGEEPVLLYTRPQPAEAGRAPLTEDAIHEEFHRRMSADAEDMAMDAADFRLGARFAERHHGILPKGKP
jgi:hypothetical protein